MTANITFDEKKTYNDWGLKVTGVDIPLPAPVIKKVEIPGRDGAIDLSEWSGRVNYSERPVAITLVGFGDYEKWHAEVSRIAAYLHGAKRKMILDTEPDYYYYGRFEIEPVKENEYVHEYVISGTVEPYKYETVSSLEPWEWDSFNFETGIIREYGGILVEGEKTLVIHAAELPVVPTIIVDCEMEVIFKEASYQLEVGENRIYGILLAAGENTLVFKGNGTVSVDYRGGSL